MSWSDLIVSRMPHIYFVYGLAFFSLGLIVAMEIGRAAPTHFSQAMRPLAIFGLAHGVYEWQVMFVIVGKEAYGFEPSWRFETWRLVFLAVSFIALIAFAVQMLRPPRRLPHFDLWLGLGMLLLYGLGVLWLGRWLAWERLAWFAAADVLARYTLALPGAVLAAWALLAQRRTMLAMSQPAFANDLLWAGVTFLLYGLIGQLFVGVSPLFPSNILNVETFQRWFGLPVQLFRAVLALMLLIFVTRALRAFEVNRQQALAEARLRVEEEIVRRDTLRQEFVRRIVETQEEERTRIARELHDELGQALTGLSIGLRGVQSRGDSSNSLRQQLSQLEEMAVQALGNMRRLVNELRPALLDDMGLAAALRHLVDNFTRLTGTQVNLIINRSQARFSTELETILFRITQEGLTNVARHARADQVWIELDSRADRVTLQIRDNGLGFDPALVLTGNERTGWGLMGIQERVNLVGGQLQIQAEPGQGTSLVVEVPLKTKGEMTDGADQDNAG